MRRFVVPALLLLLLAIQVVSLIPAYERSKLKIVEVVYRAPSPFYSSALGPAAMRKVLDGVIEERRAELTDIEPNFSVDQALLTVRFALRRGSARDVATLFGEKTSAAGTLLMAEKVTRNVAPQCAQALTECTVRSAATATAQRQAQGDALVIESISETRVPWLRPEDVLAVLVYLATLIVWLKGRNATPPSGR